MGAMHGTSAAVLPFCCVSSLLGLLLSLILLVMTKPALHALGAVQTSNDKNCMAL